MRLTRLAPPAFPLLDLAAVKAHLHVEHDADDALISDLIDVAAEWIEGREGVTRKQFRRASYRLTLPKVAGQVELPLPPLAAISAIAYVDADGAAQTLDGAAYVVVADAYVGYVEPVERWPVGRGFAIDFDCGHASAAEIPAPVRHAARLLVGHFYEHREASLVGVSAALLPMGIKDLLGPYSKPYDHRGG